MERLTRTIAAIPPQDPAVAEATRRRLDALTKPRRSLGRLEDLAVHFASIRGIALPDLPVKAVVVMAADHGVAAESVSAYPQEVTRQMLLNFARGGAAINALARHAGARLVVIDMGVREPAPSEGLLIRDRRIGPGTRSFIGGPAMARNEAVAALEAGIQIAEELADEGVTLVGLGDMGIANTTVASALTAAFTRAPVTEVVGRGTGIDDEGLERKIAVLRRALSVNVPDDADPLGTLAALGGFEIAGLAGVALGAAARRVGVVLDGFITGAAALGAARLAPSVLPYLLASHRSVEPGHRRVLTALGATPFFDLEMRLGEGTGAALAMGLVEASVRVLREMATFESAGVTDAGA